jgi:cytochrome c oxidase subunit 2
MKELLARMMPPDYSAHGWEVDRIIVVTHWLMLVMFVFWGAYFAYVLYRFRASRHPRAAHRGMESHWSTWSEAGVAVVEVLILAALAIPAWSRWASRPAAANAMEIRVIGEQFAWNIHYPGPDGVFGRRDVKLVTATNPLGLDTSDPHAKDDVVSLNNLHLEVNREALIHISSKDVIHSFKLPVMRVGQDAIPGMDVPIHFIPIRTNNGEPWEIACAQLCGLGHYRMRGQLFVDSKEDFQKWLQSQAPENPSTPAPNPVPSATPAQPPIGVTSM